MLVQDSNPITRGETRHSIGGEAFLRRFRWLVFHSWNIPPVFGLGFILLIGVLTPSQLLGILITPLEPAYIIGWLVFVMWFLPRSVRPVADWLDNKPGSSPEKALQAVKRFPLTYWTTFIVYLVIAPFSVVAAAHIYTDFVATPLSLFRIELVALIVSIIVGLPIFFLMFDLFGKALGGLELKHPIITIRTKVFLIGALVPLLIDTMLVQYYWTRTGFFNTETFGVWLMLEALAIGGSLIFAHSFGQSLGPLQKLIGTPRPLPESSIAALRPRSTDELGLLTADYRELLKELHLRNEILETNNKLLRSIETETDTGAVFNTAVNLLNDAIGADLSFLAVYDPASNSLLGVAQTDSEYRTEGHYRLNIEDRSIMSWAYRNQQTAIVEDAANDPRINPNLRERFSIRSAMATPLKLGDEVMGVLMTAYKTCECKFGLREQAIINSLGREVALALHAQRQRQARDQAEQSLRRHQEQLENIVAERTNQLEATNRELEAFSYSVSHDLRAPLRAVDGFARAIAEDYSAQLDEQAQDYLRRVRNGTQRMGDLIDDLLQLSRINRATFNPTTVNMSTMAQAITIQLADTTTEREVGVSITPGLTCHGDPGLLNIALTNLLDNAWKYSSKTENAQIEFGSLNQEGQTVYFVRDNGTGFDMQYAGKLFGAFQRLHGAEFPGTGVGLATVQRIIHRHGGRIWAEAAVGQGATFFFTLGSLSSGGSTQTRHA